MAITVEEQAKPRVHSGQLKLNEGLAQSVQSNRGLFNSLTWQVFCHHGASPGFLGRAGDSHPWRRREPVLQILWHVSDVRIALLYGKTSFCPILGFGVCLRRENRLSKCLVY